MLVCLRQGLYDEALSYPYLLRTIYLSYVGRVRIIIWTVLWRDSMNKRRTCPASSRASIIRFGAHRAVPKKLIQTPYETIPYPDVAIETDTFSWEIANEWEKKKKTGTNFFFLSSSLGVAVLQLLSAIAQSHTTPGGLWNGVSHV